MNRTKWVVLVVLGVLLAGGMGYGDDWPQFRGASRDGKSAETGLLKKWPEGGPELLWSVGGLGIGYSSVAISDGRLTIRHGDALMAYDIKGK